ncbi:PACE efflux transporter [Vibrio gangliei]|uniref:PACE efflux transporter n=1 Tax=Vibrio gangliei TaxID=2077090 RepID=UPI000D01448A|nr:PACE efflux transporter [Vibrio gangliei]
MRTTFDRLRHTICFELIGLLILTLGVGKLIHMDMTKITVLAVAFSVIATIWNYFYNIGFDKAMLKYTGQLNKSLKIRVFHASLFEFGLVLITLPIMAWYLKISLKEAFLLDIGMVVFYLVYAFIYNIIYDRIFPIPATQTEGNIQSEARE